MPYLKPAIKRKPIRTFRGIEAQKIYQDQRWWIIKDYMRVNYPLCWKCLYERHLPSLIQNQSDDLYALQFNGRGDQDSGGGRGVAFSIP